MRVTAAVPSQAGTIAGIVALLLCFGLLFRKVLTLPAFLVVLVLFAGGGLLSWVANFGYIGQHQAPLFLRTCIMALVLSATAIAGKVTGSPHTEKVATSEPSQ